VMRAQTMTLRSGNITSGMSGELAEISTVRVHNRQFEAIKNLSRLFRWENKMYIGVLTLKKPPKPDLRFHTNKAVK